MRHSALGQLCPVWVSEICHHLQMEEGQREALWKAPRFLGHHRSPGGRDTLSLFPIMICLQLAERVARRPLSPVAQGQFQPCQRSAHPASTALPPAHRLSAGGVACAFSISCMSLWGLPSPRTARESRNHPPQPNIAIETPREPGPAPEPANLASKRQSRLLLLTEGREYNTLLLVSHQFP